MSIDRLPWSQTALRSNVDATRRDQRYQSVPPPPPAHPERAGARMPHPVIAPPPCRTTADRFSAPWRSRIAGARLPRIGPQC